MGRHVVVATPPAPGHVYPVLALIEELVRRGDRVTMVTSAALAATARAAGAHVVELDWEPDTAELADREFDIEVLLGDMVGNLEATGRVLPTLLEQLAADPPAVVCADSVPLGPLLSARFSVPLVTLLANFATNERVRPEHLVPGFDPSHPGLADFGRRVGELFAGHGVPAPAPGDQPGPTLAFLPREFQMDAGTVDGSVHFVGPSLPRCRDGHWEPHGQRRVLLVSMGTAFTRRPDVFRAALEAFGHTDRQIVMAVGEYLDHDVLGPLPPNVDVAPRVPQPAVLRHADAFVSHAGMGSIMEALLYEVPVVAIPHAPEQHLNAERLVELGLGQCLHDPSATDLRIAVDHVAADPGVRRRLAAMRRAIENAGGAATAADVIDAHLQP